MTSLRITSNTHLAQTGGEHHDLVNLSHFPQKLVDAGSFKHMKMMPMKLDLDRDDEVWLRDWLDPEISCRVNLTINGTDLETAVNESFVKIEDQALPTDMLRSYWRKQRPGGAILWDAESQRDNTEYLIRHTALIGIPAPPFLISRSSSACSSIVCRSTSSSV